MKRILAIICAIAFSGAALSAQNNADTIKVSRNGSDTLVIIVKSKHAFDRQARKEQRLAEKAQKPAYMVNVGYNRGYRADIELSWANKSLWGITSSHGFSFGNGLYVGGGAGFGAELTKNTVATASVSDDVIDPEYSYTPESNWNASYFVPVFADIKYSFTKTLAAPFVSMKGGAIADITNKGIRTFANPAVGLDFARFSLKVGYEYQLGFWGHLDGKHIHNVKLGVAYTF
jgi:hypothetical protein